MEDNFHENTLVSGNTHARVSSGFTRKRIFVKIRLRHAIHTCFFRLHTKENFYQTSLASHNTHPHVS